MVSPDPLEESRALATKAQQHLAAVQELHRTLNDTYGKPVKHTADWDRISECKALIGAGYDAANVYALLSLRSAIVGSVGMTAPPIAGPLDRIGAQ